MYGNPGDYAWGRGGLDVIVTQLLNQMDGTGPPPLKGAKGPEPRGTLQTNTANKLPSPAL